MNIINPKTITFYTEQHPKAKTQLLDWYNMIKFDFDNFNELKQVYCNASTVNNQRAVFNNKGNNYRLVVAFNFGRKVCYTIWFGTHADYDKIDVETVEYKKPY